MVLVILLVIPGAALADLRREAEPNDTVPSAQPVVPPASVGGTIGTPGERDLFALRAEAGQTIQADVLARGFRATTQPGSDLSARLEILDLDGTTVLASDLSLGDFDDPSVSAMVAAAGRYFVSVSHVNPAEGGPGYSYVISFEVEDNDGFATATEILPPVIPSIDALIHPPGDRDYYRFEGQAGQVLTVDIDSAVFNPVQPPAKIVASLYDDAQTLLAVSSYSDADEDPFIQIVLPSTGSYFLGIRELRSFVGTTNTYYQLGVDLGPAFDNDSFATASPVVGPRAVSGTIAPGGDADHYLLPVAAASTIGADLDAQESLLSLLDGIVELHDGAGFILAGSGAPDPEFLSAQPAGTYSIGVAGSCATGGCITEDRYYVLYLDPDADGDGLYLPVDKCPRDSSPANADVDLDGAGEECDNCPLLFNPDQADGDGDGVGDACSGCDPHAEAGTDMSFDKPGVSIDWTISSGVGSYNLYRGDLGALPFAYDHACLQPGIPGPPAVENDQPAAGQGYYYLLAGVGLCGERTLGAGSAGQERPNAAPCP